jgi:hypothetical protein
VFKAGLVTGVMLRSTSLENPEVELRARKIYETSTKLALLGEFSKNKSGLRKAFNYGAKSEIESVAEASVNSQQGILTIQVPFLGNASASVTKTVIKGSPHLEENVKTLAIKFSLPIGEAGVFGMGIVREKFKSVFASGENFPINKGDVEAVLKAMTATAVGQGLKKGLSTIGSPISCYGSSDFTIQLVYVESIEDDSKIVPLPGRDLVRNDAGRYVMDFFAISSALNAGVDTSKIPAGDLPLAFKHLSTVSTVTKRTGPNTFHDILSKFNALMLGKKDSKSEQTTAVDSLLRGQSGQLFKLFNHIKDPQSNASFELQMLYNKIYPASGNNLAEQQALTNLFEDFIRQCEMLQGATTEEDDAPLDEIEILTSSNGEPPAPEPADRIKQYNAAAILFRRMLDIQHERVFLPHYNSAFVVQKKS